MQYAVFLVTLLSCVRFGESFSNECEALTANLCPRKGLIPEKLLGRWRPYGNFFVKKSLVRPALLNTTVECGAYTMARQQNSENFAIKLEYDAVERRIHTERVGENIVNPNDPSKWKKRFTVNGDPNEWWYEAVLATDYENYWIQYECTVTDGMPVENIGIRTRTGVASRKEKQIYASLLAAYGFDMSSPNGAFVPVHQSRTCWQENAGNTRHVPNWFEVPEEDDEI